METQNRVCFCETSMTPHQMAVNDLEGSRFKRSHYVVRVGFGPCSMVIGPRFLK